MDKNGISNENASPCCVDDATDFVNIIGNVVFVYSWMLVFFIGILLCIVAVVLYVLDCMLP